MRKNPPQTVDQAVEELAFDLSLKSRTTLANMPEDELPSLQYSSLAMYIRNNFGLRDANYNLVESCCLLSGENWLDADTACFIIIHKLWEKLKETHRLRVIK